MRVHCPQGVVKIHIYIYYDLSWKCLVESVCLVRIKVSEKVEK